MHHAAWATVKQDDRGDHEPSNRFGIRSRSWIDRKQAGKGSLHSEMQSSHQPQAQAGEVCQGCMASEDQTDGDEVMKLEIKFQEPQELLPGDLIWIEIPDPIPDDGKWINDVRAVITKANGDQINIILEVVLEPEY